MGSAPVLTGDPRTDRALVSLARLLLEIAAGVPAADSARAGAPAAAPREDGCRPEGDADDTVDHDLPGGRTP